METPASVGRLVEVIVDSLNRVDEAEEWEEVDFMVDSGAGASVIAETDVKAVVACDPDPPGTSSWLMGARSQTAVIRRSTPTRRTAYSLT